MNNLKIKNKKMDEQIKKQLEEIEKKIDKLTKELDDKFTQVIGLINFLQQRIRL